MMNMYAAITLSTGSKAKTRTADGAIIVVEMHYMGATIEWLMSRIEANGDHDGTGYRSNIDHLSDVLTERGVSPDEDVWLSVETPFPEEQE
jgi:hypothetical protein